MIFLVLGMLSGARSDEENKKTIVSFNHRVEIPEGGQVLPAGKYVFKVLDPAANPNIVQILSEDEKHLYGTIMAIPKYRSRQSEKTVMTFSAKGTGGTEGYSHLVLSRVNSRRGICVSGDAAEDC